MAPGRAVRIHVWAFCAGVMALALANWLSGGPWWSFWPIVAWSVALSGHYFVHRARAADERWAEQRAADLRAKSYDASHIDSIAERYDVKASGPPQKPK